VDDLKFMGNEGRKKCYKKI
jgi:hypothetical protein